MSTTTAASTAVGLQLRRERERRSLSLEQVSQATRIRVRYLQAIESGELDSLPSMAQARGFLRAYAGFLKLDAQALLDALNPPAAEQGEELAKRPAANIPVSNIPASSLPEISTPILSDLADSPQPEESASSPAAVAEEQPPGSPGAAPVVEAAPAPDPGREAFLEIGKRLQRQRELLGLSLDDVVRYTHLRHHYLQALEAGNLDALPSPVQGRGMLNNYAAFLGLDHEAILLLFAEGLQARLGARQAARQEGRPRPERREPVLPLALRRLFSLDILIGVLVVGLIIAFVGWGAIRIYTMRSEQEATPTAPSIADILLASATPTVTFTPAPVTPTSQLLLPPAAATITLMGVPLEQDLQGKVQVYITVNQRAWMRVAVDGKVEFEGRVVPGSAYPFVGESQVEIITGNGAALQIFYNQQDLGPMGNFGEVVNRIFTLQGVFLPTATITPTPTITPLVSPTPTATSTLPPAQVTAPAIP
ncbi:MAG: DUF4115 domain-containing protein [Anaerolineales bacterium]|nr:DUF4115 domain-containing protein [Anaerolineales bacterium]